MALDIVKNGIVSELSDPKIVRNGIVEDVNYIYSCKGGADSLVWQRESGDLIVRCGTNFKVDYRLDDFTRCSDHYTITTIMTAKTLMVAWGTIGAYKTRCDFGCFGSNGARNSCTFTWSGGNFIYTDNSKYQDGKLHKFTFKVNKPNSAQLYIDDVLVNSFSVSSFNKGQFYIGCRPNSADVNDAPESAFAKYTTYPDAYMKEVYIEEDDVRVHDYVFRENKETGTRQLYDKITGKWFADYYNSNSHLDVVNL